MTHDNDTTGHNRQSERLSDASDVTEIVRSGEEHIICGVRSDLVTARQTIALNTSVSIQRYVRW
jgi:hypothetical protein